jgi:DNA-binding SARP family transcriptional activator
VIEFRLLGAFEVASGGQPLPIGSSKQRRLLAMLAVNLNQPVSLDELLEELWDGRPPVTAVTTAQGLVSRLRRLLTGIRLTSSPTGYVLEAHPDQVDANRFDGLISGGRDALTRGDPAGGAALDPDSQL